MRNAGYLIPGISWGFGWVLATNVHVVAKSSAMKTGSTTGALDRRRSINDMHGPYALRLVKCWSNSSRSKMDEDNDSHDPGSPASVNNSS